MKKRNKIFTKLLCIALVCVTLITSMGAYSGDIQQTIAQYAEGLSESNPHLENTVPKELQSIASQEIGLIENIGFTADYLQQVNIVSDNDLVYIYRVGDITSQINVANNSGYISYDIQEGALNNVIDVYYNGDIRVDGQLLEVTNNYQTNNSRFQVSIVDYWTEDCPYGIPSDYGDLHKTINEADVQFKKSLITYSASALAALLGLALKPLASLGLGLLVGLATFLQDENPSSTSASVIDYVYRHSETGWWVDHSPGKSLAVQKHSMYLYAQTDFEGNSTHILTYECRTI